MENEQHTPGPLASFKWVKARTMQHLHDENGGTGISAPLITQRDIEEGFAPKMQGRLDAIAAAPETARERDGLKLELANRDAELYAVSEASDQWRVRAENAEKNCADLLCALKHLTNKIRIEDQEGLSVFAEPMQRAFDAIAKVQS